MAKRRQSSLSLSILSVDDLAQLSPAKKRELDELLFGYADFQRLYRYAPAAFVEECLDWNKITDRPTTYQLNCLDNLVRHGREAVRGPHGLGKTALSSWAALWFALTRDGQDWKIVTTAGAWRQLTHFLWPEIHKWERLVRWELVGRPPLVEKQELLDRSLKLRTGEAFAVASDQPALIEGAHADHLLYLYDESKSIQDQTFDAAEGAFSGAGPDTGREALALATSTPGPPSGRFYAIHSRKRGYEDWHARHVTVEEAKDAGRISQDWQDRRKRQWGEDSTLYQNRVLGEFAANDETSVVIPLAWVEAANERWLAWHDALDEREPLPPLVAIGVDVAWEGSDRTGLAFRQDHNIIEAVEIFRRLDPLQTANKVAAVQRQRGGTAIVDSIGLGAGTLVRLRELDQPVIGFVAGAAATTSRATAGRRRRKGGSKALGSRLTDESGEIEFADLRSAAWWYLRDLLNPANHHDVMLPPDEFIQPLPDEDPPSLTGELCAPTWDQAGGGKIRVESKKDVKVRIGRSTDLADPVVQAFAKDFLRQPTHGTPLSIISGPSKWRV